MLFMKKTRSGIKQAGVVVKLQTCILEVLCSNLGPYTGYPHLEFSRFSKPLHANIGIISRLDNDRFLPNPFRLIIRQSFLIFGAL
jgi:hypothetical protein